MENKNLKSLVIIIILGAIVITGGFLIKGSSKTAMVPVGNQQAQGITGTTDKGGSIVIDNLAQGQTIHTPFTVTGMKGGWFFEGSFPVFMKDNAGNQIGVGLATSTQDWMTANPIPFSVTLPATNYTGPGTLMFHNDNASGEPQNDDWYVVNVIFN